ncbi:precorrin-3B synthase [Plantactinospora sp. KLBMP9567]|uniref:precorrin-3B synthase n=1 Tax=Plantactinospora sp. KLBMP9567 TaxID=3085900 RepID=UPI002981DE04|nr:precorrin-3B synthase [Plantactinospora sp. KLBMP9567]MDW5324798.1 precorrin-3B synthase [Plantactinospora sp. KLBMP9567]MDW5330591.1 precorrin-3B synthase [Plantactinospora sp. KLBMP9567]
MSALATPSPRPPEDRCPGALRAHQAADGLLVRVRLPGGQLRPAQLRVLADLARDESDGALELTSRGNLQLRRLADDAAVRRVADRIAEVGLLPTATHERVRNLLASPLSGRDRAGRLDVRPLVRDLDAALRGAADLASLSGRFLFALDDGRHDVAALGADLCWTGGSQTLWLAGTDTGLRAGPDEVVELLVAAARAFLRVRGERRDLWRLADLPAGPARVTAALGRPTSPVTAPPGASGAAPAPLASAVAFPSGASGGTSAALASAGAAPPRTSGAAPAPVVGARPDGVVVAGVRLGRLTADQAHLLADLAGRDEIIVTPWRSLVLDTGGPDIVGRLATAGLLVDPASPWLGVTACTGRPGCASALADVRGDVTEALADAGPAGGTALPVHVVGCERRCGRPAGPAVLAVATGTGYRIEAGGTSRPGTPAAALAVRAERQK